jgi:hypothetical protein
LALFARWPPQRVDGLGIPASENLHRCGHDAASALGSYVPLAGKRWEL